MKISKNRDTHYRRDVFVMYLLCPNCKFINIADNFIFCPMCGEKIEWVK